MNVASTPISDVDLAPPVDSARLEEVFARHQSELLGLLCHLLGNRDEASDAYQDAFIKCWRRRELLSEVQNLKAWVFQVAMNAARDARTTAWKRRRMPLAEESALPASPVADPRAATLDREDHERLRAAISGLRLEEREVFLLRENGDLTYEEIAVTLAIPVGTVKTRMRLAIEKLRLVLAESPEPE